MEGSENISEGNRKAEGGGKMIVEQGKEIANARGI